MRITAIIPARSGSKRIPNKNIKLYANKPLLYWSILLATKLPSITNIVLSTDCEYIANLAKSYFPHIEIIMRPPEISTDLSTDYEFMKHYLNTTTQVPNIIIHLRPTYPNRKLEILQDCLTKFINSDYDSLRTVCEVTKPPFKMYTINNNILTPLFTEDEPYNKPAQLLPTCYWHNGYIDIIKTETILNGSISGTKILPYIMDKTEVDDIDTEEEWQASEIKFYKNII